MYCFVPKTSKIVPFCFPRRKRIFAPLQVNDFMLNVTDKCVISPAASERGVPKIRDIICVF